MIVSKVMSRDITCSVILGVCVLFLLPTTTTGITSNALEGSPQILSFTAETWDSSTEHWKSSTDVRRGDHIRLICTIDDDSDSEMFIIRRLDEENALERLLYSNSRQIWHEFGNVDCDKTGTYVCEGGRGKRKTMDLKVFDCTPQILSFTHEQWDLSENQWKVATDIERGKDIRLVCTINGPFSEKFSIRKLHETVALAPLQSPNLRQIVYVFRNFDCEKTGSYVCENGQGLNRTLDLVLFDCSPRMPILSFAFEEWDPDENQWRSSTEIESGEDVRLICTVDGPFSKMFTLKKQHEKNALASLEYPSTRQIIHVFRNVSCDTTATYVCENGDGATKTTELGIFGCEPRFCDKEEASTTTAVMGLRNAEIFSVCIAAFPDINVAMTSPTVAKSSTETKVGARHVSNIPSPAKETADQSALAFDIEPKPGVFGEYSLFISMTISSMDDYGVYTVTIFTTHKGQRKELKYTIVLQPSETSSSDCPADLRATEQNTDSLTLSWQSGLNEGSTQLFQVYVATDDGEWVPFGNATEENSVHVSGLHEDTQYAFKVVSVNEFSQLLSGHRCASTLRIKTGNSIDGSDDDVERFSATYLVLIAMAGLLVATIAIVFVLRRRRNTINKDKCASRDDVEKSLVAGSNNRDQKCTTSDISHEDLVPGSKNEDL